MSYYDFSNEAVTKNKKLSRGSLLLLLALALAAASFLIWHTPHKESPPQAHSKPIVAAPPKQAVIVAQAQPIILPAPLKAAPKVAPAQAVVSSPAQGLQFYELLKKKQPQVHAQPNLTTTRYELQVASVTSWPDAMKWVQLFRGKKWPAHVVSTHTSDHNRWLRVLIGPYKTAQKAERIAQKLQQTGHPGALIISN